MAEETGPAGASGVSRLGEVFVELADTLVAEYEVLDFLYLVCERCAEVLDVEAVGALLTTDAGELALSAASTEEARVLELFESQQREGPCYDAFVSGEVVMESELEGAGVRWPVFAPRALEAGFRAVYGFPLRLRDEVIGALNMFRREPSTLTEVEVTVARTLADAATIGIMNERVVRGARLRSEQLQHALDNRVVIEQAKGVLAERLAISPGEAFERIRRHARGRRRAIHGVAQAIVAGDLEIG